MLICLTSRFLPPLASASQRLPVSHYGNQAAASIDEEAQPDGSRKPSEDTEDPRGWGGR